VAPSSCILFHTLFCVVFPPPPPPWILISVFLPAHRPLLSPIALNDCSLSHSERSLPSVHLVGHGCRISCFFFLLIQRLSNESKSFSSLHRSSSSSARLHFYFQLNHCTRPPPSSSHAFHPSSFPSIFAFGRSKLTAHWLRANLMRFLKPPYASFLRRRQLSSSINPFTCHQAQCCVFPFAMKPLSIPASIALLLRNALNRHFPCHIPIGMTLFFIHVLD